MVDVYQIIDNSAPCRRIICCRPPVSDNLPPIWRQRSQRLSSLHSAALCTADQQQIDVHCTEHFVSLCTTHQKTEECTARRKMHSAPTPFHFTNWSKDVKKCILWSFLWWTQNTWVLLIGQCQFPDGVWVCCWDISFILPKSALMSTIECKVIVMWRCDGYNMALCEIKDPPMGRSNQPDGRSLFLSSAQPRPVNCSQCSSFAKLQYFDVASFCHSEWEIGCKIFLL